MVNIKGKIVYNAGRGLICVGAVLALDDLPWRLEHKIVVLGGEETWRESPCVACPHVVCTKGLYMNGTVYYGAFMKDIDSPSISIIVRFDVRFETFNIFKVPSKLVPVGYEFMWKERGWSPTDKTLLDLLSSCPTLYYLIIIAGLSLDNVSFSFPQLNFQDLLTNLCRTFLSTLKGLIPTRMRFETLINYGGKIGVVESPRVCGFRLWVGEDAEKEEWSMSTLHLPESYVGVDFEIMDTFF
ncbi:BnaC09g21200D [Brassica napus]|uniref:(rape) hypothetical protein n=1 Tax=Brassica napus TaxID=3708 RepID=A0A078FXE4_BRANA|nr:unnamed protein product [Brassica napus]CDY17417.1 BnaC09g21200D [Brassica napus]